MDDNLLEVLAEALGVETIDLLERTALSHQQLIMIKMVRIVFLSECMDDAVRKGDILEDLENAVDDMDDEKLAAFIENVPKLQRAMERATAAFELARTLALAASENETDEEVAGYADEESNRA